MFEAIDTERDKSGTAPRAGVGEVSDEGDSSLREAVAIAIVATCSAVSGLCPTSVQRLAVSCARCLSRSEELGSLVGVLGQVVDTSRSGMVCMSDLVG